MERGYRMKSFNILSQGEKIKTLRDQINIKQEDLAGGDITRNLISILENNKANLTPATAKVIATNFNNLCIQMGIDLQVTEEYLLEGEVEQAKKIADEYISFVKNISTETISDLRDRLNEINLFLKMYDCEEKRAELYMGIGLKFKSCSKYITAIDYFLKAYESTKDRKLTVKSLFYMGVCKIYASKHVEAIDNFSLILDLDDGSAFKYHALFNIALCYKKLGRFEEALEVTEKLEVDYKEFIDNSKNSLRVSINMLKGACLCELKAFNKAIEIYKELLKLEEINEEKVIVLSALTDVYRTTRDKVNLEKICSKILVKIDSKEFNEKYEADIYLCLAKSMSFVNLNKEQIISLLYNALESYKSGKSDMCFEEVQELFSYLLELFIEQKDIERIGELRNDLLELIGNGAFQKYNAITLQFIKHYNETCETEEIASLIEFISA